MLVKTVVGLLAASAAVVAAPAVKEEVDVTKDVDVDGHRTYDYKSDDQYGAEKYVYDNYGAEQYDYDNYEAETNDYETVYAKEIVCPASYKILYTHVPVKCDCKTETRYEKPADIDFKNVQYEKEYKGYENKGY
ncbi:hypothetical protein SeMB42_g01520 [Synchytrium endobioticum]|uniref:Uncharacterized protein n=1 Tax=Synchytrium endobioticum TaxID=286115 RepID=A0A507CG78_9FUNG|nr:hypothetical protein SeLEV6574_g07776 [Synchytrium endobioticum]TPX52275.1 hypothetical protein SeMB42_g01520 [Synchytrium endobioticum]